MAVDDKIDPDYEEEFPSAKQRKSTHSSSKPEVDQPAALTPTH